MANNVVAIDHKSQKPSSSAFKQQKLPSWSPILTVGTVLPTFFLIGVAFIPIGIGLLVSSNQVKEIELNYTTCEQWTGSSDQPKRTKPVLCADVIAQIKGECQCRINFTIDEDIRRDVYLYYGLTNFYQNHRRYVKSRDDRQLLGEGLKSPKDCVPFAERDQKEVAPCGAIANSLFNDTFQLQRYPDAISEASRPPQTVPVIKTGIAWATDKNAKFRNPKVPEGQNLSYAFLNTVQPPNWQKPVYQLDPKNPNNNGYLNEDLIVWMRTAALPTFRKLWGRIAHDKDDNTVNYHSSLPKGRYVLIVNYNYPVVAFKGTKRFIISNTSWLGGKNPFIGIMYIVVGFVCLLLSAIFVFIHKKFGKSRSEILNINQRTPYIG